MEQVSIKKVSNLKNKKFDFVLGEHDIIRSRSNEYYIYIFFFIFSVPVDQALQRMWKVSIKQVSIILSNLRFK